MNHNIILIKDEARFAKFIPTLKAFCESTACEHDSVEIMEEAEALECADCIKAPKVKLSAYDLLDIKTLAAALKA